MDLFGKKSRVRIEALEEYIERLRAQHDSAIGDNMRAQYDHEVEVTALRTENEILVEEYEHLKYDNVRLMGELQELKDQIQSEEAYVKLTFATDNYEVVTPHIAITDDSFENLFNIRAIDDTQANNQQAIRLALLNLAREALEQICSDFMGELN